MGATPLAYQYHLTDRTNQVPMHFISVCKWQEELQKLILKTGQSLVSLNISVKEEIIVKLAYSTFYEFPSFHFYFNSIPVTLSITYYQLTLRITYYQDWVLFG